MPDFVKIEASTIEAENAVRQMVDSLRLFRAGKVNIVNFSPPQKTALRTQYTDSLAALKAAISAIDTEMAA